MNDFQEKNMDAIERLSRTINNEMYHLSTFLPTAIIVDKIHESVELIKQKTDMDSQTSCGSGCSNCCHDEILISLFEATRIIEAIKDVPRDYKLLAKQNAVERFKDLKWADQKCALLDSKNRCSIYENRPMICRTHNSTDDPKYCNLGENPTNGHGQLFTVEFEAMTLAMIGSSNGETTSMHKLLLGII